LLTARVVWAFVLQLSLQNALDLRTEARISILSWEFGMWNAKWAGT